jgi:hypothetical protein
MLTGVTRHRTSWRGKLILQIEYGHAHSLRWRDATERDMFELKKLKIVKQWDGLIFRRVGIIQRQEGLENISVL